MTEVGRRTVRPVLTLAPPVSRDEYDEEDKDECDSI